MKCRKCLNEFIPSVHQLNKKDFLCLPCKRKYDFEWRQSRSVMSLSQNKNITKKCTCCSQIKPLPMFYCSVVNKDGHQTKCKECAKEHSRKWRLNHKDVQKNNTNRWRKENPDRIKLIGRKAMAKMRNKPMGKLNNNMSRGMHRSLHGLKNHKKWLTLVNYTVEQLKTHIESKFTEGMSWDNYGQWHIDHIIPISVFNFEIPEDIDFKKCWALKNLQPMWAKDNITKYNKLEKSHQPSLAISI